MKLNNYLFGGEQPFVDTGQKEKIRILSTIKDMKDCEEKKDLMYFLQNSFKSKEHHTKELLEFVYAYRDTFEYGTFGFTQLDSIAQQLEKR